MSVASLYTPCFVMFCVFLYGPFCHGAHKPDLSTLFTTFFLWTSHPFIFTKGSLLNQYILYLYLILSRTLDLIRKINGDTKLASNFRRYYFSKLKLKLKTSRCCYCTEWNIATILFYYEDIVRTVCLLFPHHNMWGDGGYNGFALSRPSVGRSVGPSVSNIESVL